MRYRDVQRTAAVKLLLWIMICLVIASLAQGKKVNGRFLVFLDEEKQKSSILRYVTHFGCSTGTCTMSLSGRIANLPKVLSALPSGVREQIRKEKDAAVAINIFLDEEWEKFDIGKGHPRCSEYASLSNLARVKTKVPLSLSQPTWSSSGLSHLRQTVRPHVWYITVDDCSQRLREGIENALAALELDKKLLAGVPPLVVEYQTELIQADGSHASYEFQWMPTVLFFEIVAFSIVLAAFFYKEIQHAKVVGGIPRVVQFINASALLLVVGIFLHWIHIVVMRRNGMGIWVCDVIGDICQMLSQTTLVTAMVYVALGVSLDCEQLVPNHVLYGAAIGIMLFHALIIINDKNTVHLQYRFHINEGFVGLVFAISRMVMFGAFLIANVVMQSSKTASVRVKEFIRKFAIGSTPYFLSYPFLLTLTLLFPRYLKHKFLYNAQAMGQFVCLVLLLDEFLSAKRSFAKVSAMGASLLPLGAASSTFKGA